jgi:DNA mismatch endonuclease (patch repair protein)
MDRLDQQQRSENMRRIRSRNTAPELQVRRLIHAMGYRYRLHDKTLPGTPDLVFGSRKSIIFVHGCFWHLHRDCNEGRLPATRQDYWIPKLTRNVERDRQHTRALKKLGWRVLQVWECELKSKGRLARRLTRFLSQKQLTHSEWQASCADVSGILLGIRKGCN